MKSSRRYYKGYKKRSKKLARLQLKEAARVIGMGLVLFFPEFACSSL